MGWIFLAIDDIEAELAGTASQLARVCPGATVLTAGSGEAALIILEERRIIPSLIFLDYGMPRMNGIEFLTELRTRRWLERAPVVIVSEPIADRHIVTCYRMGAGTFLTKPIHQFDLRQAIRDYARPAQQMAAASIVSVAAGAQRSAA